MNPLIRLVFCCSIVFFWLCHLFEHQINLVKFMIHATWFRPHVDPNCQNVSWVFDEKDNKHLKIPGSLEQLKHPDRPNIILIVADDLGYYDLHGDHETFTSNIRSIGEKGATFTNAYAGHATCAPSRASLMTGRFPTRFGFEFTPVPVVMAEMLGTPNLDRNHSHAENIIHADRFRRVPAMDEMVVPTSEVFLPEALQSVGYRTLFFGKWHLGSTPESLPSKRGFQHTLGFLMGASHYAKPDSPDIVHSKITGLKFDKLLWDKLPYAVQLNDGPLFTPDRYMTDYLAEEAAEAIMACRSVGADHSRPFFIELAFNAPHNPLAALVTDYNNPLLENILGHRARVYAAMILALDRAVGTVLTAVEAIGETDNTVIMFTSDNGGPDYIGLHGINRPYRGWKATMFEGGLKVPFFVKWPARIDPGTIVTSTVSHVDIFTTALAAAGASSQTTPKLKDTHLDGKNLLSVVRTVKHGAEIGECYGSSELDKSIGCPNNGHQYLYWRSGHYRAMRFFDWKLAVADIPKRVWLYNLGDDQTERVNIASDMELDVLVAWTHQGCFEAARGKYANLTDATWIQTVNDKLRAIGEVTRDTALITRMQFACSLLRGLEFVDGQQVEPLWPSVSETVLRVDQPSFLEGTSDGWNARRGEEFVYWPN